MKNEKKLIIKKLNGIVTIHFVINTIMIVILMYHIIAGNVFGALFTIVMLSICLITTASSIRNRNIVLRK